MSSLSSSFARFAKRSAGVITFLLGTSVLSGVIAPDPEGTRPLPEPESAPLTVTSQTGITAGPASDFLARVMAFQDTSREAVMKPALPLSVEPGVKILPAGPTVAAGAALQASALAGLSDFMDRATLSRTDIRALQGHLQKVSDPRLNVSGSLNAATLKALQKAVLKNPALAAHLGEAVLQAFAKQGKLDDLGKALADTPAARDTFAQTILAQLKKEKAESGAAILPYKPSVEVLQAALRDFRLGAVDGYWGGDTTRGVERYEAKLAQATAVRSAHTPTDPTRSDVSESPASPAVTAYPALSKQTFDKASVKAIQTVLGVKASGVLTPGTAKALRDFLKEHPDAHASLGKATVRLLKDAGELPKAVGDLGRFLRENPGQVRAIGEGLIATKGDAYLYRLAIRVAGGAGSIKDMHNPLKPAELSALEASLVKVKVAEARKPSDKAQPDAASTSPPTDLSKFQPFLTAPTLDKSATKNLQTLLGFKKPSGVFDAPTGERIRAILAKNPEAVATLGKGLTEALSKTRTLPSLAGDLARLFRNDPDKIRTLGHAALTSGTPPYLFQLALKAAAGETDVRDADAPLTEARLNQAFGDVLFLTKGITSATPAKDAKGQYIPDPMGLSLLAFSPTNKANVKACQDALTKRGFDADTPKEGAGKKFATALATLLSKDAPLLDRLVKSGGPGVAVFGYLLSDKKRAAEAGRILGSSPNFQTGLVKDLIQYGAELDSALSVKAGPKGKKTASLESPDKNALALRLGLVSKEKDYRPDPTGNAFSKPFALAAAAYLRGPLGKDELPAVQSLKRQAASVYTAASRLKMTVVKSKASTPSVPSLGIVARGKTSPTPPSVEILKKRYPHDKYGIVETVAGIAGDNGLNAATLLAIVDMESTLNPTARPIKPNGERASTAYGLAQALDGTWMSWWKKFGASLGIEAKPQTQEEILNLRADPRVAVTLMAKAIKASGAKNPLHAYWNIHFGSGGASALRNADPQTSVATALNCGKTMGANTYLNGLTVGELAAKHTAELAKRGGMESLFADSGVGPSQKLPGVGPVTFHVPLAGRTLPGGFGMRVDPVNGGQEFHRGLDLRAPAGTPIYAAADGVIQRVAYEGWNGGFGRHVVISHGGGRFSTIYAHMSQPAEGLSVGMRVNAGEKIGAVGSTGKSTGNHLHYGLQVNGIYVDPGDYAHVTFNTDTGIRWTTAAEKPSTPSRSTRLAQVEITLPKARQSFGLGELTATRLAEAFSPPPLPSVQPAVVGPDPTSASRRSWALAALMNNLSHLSPIATAHAEMLPVENAPVQKPSPAPQHSPTSTFRVGAAQGNPIIRSGPVPTVVPLAPAVAISGYGSPRMAFNPCAIIRELPESAGFKRTAISLVCGGPT